MYIQCTTEDTLLVSSLSPFLPPSLPLPLTHIDLIVTRRGYVSDGAGSLGGEHDPVLYQSVFPHSAIQVTTRNMAANLRRERERERERESERGRERGREGRKRINKLFIS